MGNTAVGRWKASCSVDAKLDLFPCWTSAFHEGVIRDAYQHVDLAGLGRDFFVACG